LHLILQFLVLRGHAVRNLVDRLDGHHLEVAKARIELCCNLGGRKSHISVAQR
jgi:hypothetical protein